MHRHESYKYSEIDWIGEIPSHWDTVQPKYKLNRVTRPTDEDDEVITCFRDGVVTLRKNRREDGFTNSIKEHGYQQIRPGDLVVHEMDGFAGAIGISDSKGKSTPVYTVVEPDNQVDLRYVAYLLREMSKTGKIESLARSIRERTTDFRWNMWSTIHFPFPPIDEQKLISSHLDKKTEQIDDLIEKIQKKIELLKEQRTSLINQCVTKGLEPNVEMEDSGVEWIGEIPRHWGCERIKFVSQQISDKRLPIEGDIKISPENVEAHTGKILNLYSDYETEGQIFQSGDILFNKLRVYLNKVVLCEFDGLSMGEMIVIRPKSVSGSFLHRVLNSSGFIDNVNSLSEGVKLPRPPVDGIFNSLIPIPPKYEQYKIKEYLKKRLVTTDRIVDKYRERINLILEYRQSLISSVVTGKVRVTEGMM